MKLFDNAQLVSGFVPVDLSDGANTGDYVSLKNYSRCAIVLFKAVGTAGDDPTLTVVQATDVSGTSAKAVNFTAIKVKQGASLAAIGTFTNATQSAANTYTSTTSAEEQAIWVVEIDASDLDVDGGFDCIMASVADIGTNAQIGCMFYILDGPRYAGATMPSAIA